MQQKHPTARAESIDVIGSTKVSNLDTQALFIDGFKQARDGVTVHLDCQSYHLFGQ